MADIEANQKKMDELNKTWEQKLKEAADNEVKMKDLKGMLRKLMVENADLKKYM